MKRDRRALKATLRSAVRSLPVKDRRALREFLAYLSDEEPRPKKKRKIHSWHRKGRRRGRLVKPKSPRSIDKPDPQLPLPFD